MYRSGSSPHRARSRPDRHRTAAPGRHRLPAAQSLRLKILVIPRFNSCLPAISNPSLLFVGSFLFAWTGLGNSQFAIGTMRDYRLTRFKLELPAIELHRN